ncbi:MAG: PspC domain-containing protein, partial [Patulibacter sp.]|nr:PspC domain-containing protein [Patulibacter sp.]
MTDPAPQRWAAATFRRPERGHGRLVLGVCAGLARRWDLEPRTVRAAFAVTLVPFGAGLLVYGALAAVMPADGASDRSVGRRGELGRSLAQAIVVLLGLFGMALVAAASAGLAVFGLGPIALLLATATLTAVIVLRDGRLWLLGVATLALAVPAAVVELSDTTIARQAGREVVTITTPGDVRAQGYRAGTGPLLLDLRRFDADDATVTTIRARCRVPVSESIC